MSKTSQSTQIYLDRYRKEVIGSPVDYYDDDQKLRSGIVQGVTLKQGEVKLTVQSGTGVISVKMSSIKGHHLL